MKAETLPEKRWIISKRVFIESEEEGHVILFERECSRRIRITRSLYSLLLKFSNPATFTEIRQSAALPTTVEKALDDLLAKGFLVDADAPLSRKRERALQRNPYTLFNTPRCREGNCASDIAVIGLPYDLGSQVASGARRGPTELRLHSNAYDYRVDFATGRPVGWYDVDHDRWVLDGVRICDRGDLWFAYGETPEAVSERLTEICATPHGRSAILAFLGGDHSLTYPIVEALQRTEPLVVVWWDAHTDMGHFNFPSGHNHFSVARRVLSLPQVVRLVQVGHHGFTMKDEVHTTDPRRIVVTARTLCTQGVQAILEHIPPEAACYMSIDLDVLDPGAAPSVSSPVPGGLMLAEAAHALYVICSKRRFKGLDLVEFNPEMGGTQRSASAACSILMAALGGIMSYRKQSSG